MNQDLWNVDRFDEFLNDRCRLLAIAMNEFLDEFISPGEREEEDDERQILETIEADESQTLEFKSSLRWDIVEGHVNKVLERMVTKSIAGLANAEGGILLIGVGDKKNILGLDYDYAVLNKSHGERDSFEQQVLTVVGRDLGQSVLAFVSVTFHLIDGKDICRVAVERSDHPVYLTDEGKTSLYVRLGNKTEPLLVDQAVSYVGSHWKQ